MTTTLSPSTIQAIADEVRVIAKDSKNQEPITKLVREALQSRGIQASPRQRIQIMAHV